MRESWREEIWKCDINKKDPPQGDDIPWLCIKKVTQNLSWPGNSLKPILRDGLLSGSSVGDYQPSYCSVHKMQKNNTYPKKWACPLKCAEYLPSAFLFSSSVSTMLISIFSVSIFATWNNETSEQLSMSGLLISFSAERILSEETKKVKMVKQYSQSLPEHCHGGPFQA